MNNHIFFGQLGIPQPPPINFLDTFTKILIPNATHPVDGSLWISILPKSINSKFSWISDGCTTNSVFAYKDNNKCKYLYYLIKSILQ